MSLAELKQKVWYIWADTDQWKKRPRKTCQGETCPLSTVRGHTEHCKHYGGGWCYHTEYGEPFDEPVIPLKDVEEFEAGIRQEIQKIEPTIEYYKSAPSTPINLKSWISYIEVLTLKKILGEEKNEL